MNDLAQQTHYFSNSVIEPKGQYEYDALYRLTKATGRELTSLQLPTHEDFSNNITVPNAASNAMQNYTQTYQYDKLGNIIQMKSGSQWTRDYVYDLETNYLLKHDSEQTLNDYTYDAHGNMLTMPHLTTMAWDTKDQLVGAGNGTFQSFYAYDNTGNRTRKVVVKGNVREERYYLGGFEVYRKTTNGILDVERKTQNVFDIAVNQVEESKEVKFEFDLNKRIVLIETKTGESPVIRYQHSNHLGSATLELDQNAGIISYEEYHPFGTTSYRSGRSETETSLKRYKYIGKERDEETGLYYYGARYYAGWIGIWISVDPLQNKYPGWSPFNFTLGNPTKNIDPDGREVDPDSEKNIQHLINPSSPTYNKGFAEKFSILKEDKNAVYSFKPKGKPNINAQGQKEYGSVSYEGTNDLGQYLINVNYVTNSGTSGLSHQSILLEETAHAVQFSEGKFGFKTNGSTFALDIHDEAEAKIFAALNTNDKKFNLEKAMIEAFNKGGSEKVVEFILKRPSMVGYSQLIKDNVNVVEELLIDENNLKFQPFFNESGRSRISNLIMIEPK
jgi:RHS repeat-associated protein